jgi:hypothetical protein
MTAATSYLSPKVEARAVPSKGGYGTFAVAPIEKDECLFVWGGEIVTEAQFAALSDEVQRHSVQVEEGMFMVPNVVGPADYVNHSCEPNAGMQGQITMVAMRAIQPGEEIVYDYAMTDGAPYDEFDCKCGAATCRQRVTGEDWRRPELITRYQGYFSTYLQRRIDSLREK